MVGDSGLSCLIWGFEGSSPGNDLDLDYDTGPLAHQYLGIWEAD